MDEGTLIMCGLKSQRVLESIDVVISQHAGGGHPFKLVPDYDTENISRKVVRIILSYTDYVNRVVWFK
jgi:UDP-N-acetylglucosamine 2-epimerase (non-hydrolysing)